MSGGSEKTDNDKFVENFKTNCSAIQEHLTLSECKIIAGKLRDKSMLNEGEFEEVVQERNTPMSAAEKLLGYLRKKITPKNIHILLDILINDLNREELAKIMTSSAQDASRPQTEQNTYPSAVIRRPPDVRLDIGATQASSEEEEEGIYNMPYSPHGRCIIINNVDFRRGCPLLCRCLDAPDTREGSHKDSGQLKKTFRELDYEIKYYQNLTSSEMEECLKKEAMKDHSKFDSFVCCILSHGDEGAVFGSDWKQAYIDKLLQIFESDKCRELADKPKIFIIQACRGDQEDPGVTVASGTADGGPSSNLRTSFNSPSWKTIPIKSDFLICYACVFGNVSYRYPRSGSPYIQTLCKVLKEDGKSDDLMSMMTKVNRKVKNMDIGGSKQMPEQRNVLSGKVYFKRQKQRPAH